MLVSLTRPAASIQAAPLVRALLDAEAQQEKQRKSRASNARKTQDPSNNANQLVLGFYICKTQELMREACLPKGVLSHPACGCGERGALSYPSCHGCTSSTGCFAHSRSRGRCISAPAKQSHPLAPALKLSTSALSPFPPQPLTLEHVRLGGISCFHPQAV